MWRHRRSQLPDVGKDLGLDLVLQFVRELIAVGSKDLDAVVVPWIVRGRDHDAGGKSIGSGQIGNAGCRDNSRADYPGPRRLQASRQDRTDPGTRFAGVLPDQDARVFVPSRQTLPQSPADREYALLVERIRARYTPNSIGPK